MAISADERKMSVMFARQGRIDFPLLSDTRLAVATAYGVAMVGEDIAIPATFLVGQNGDILYKTVGETMADRPDLDDIIAIIDELEKT